MNLDADIFTIRLPARHTEEGDASESPRARAVRSLFSLSRTQPHPILSPIDIPLRPGTIVFITGPSGGGKSTILRAIQEHALGAGRPCTSVDGPEVASRMTSPDAADRAAARPSVHRVIDCLEGRDGGDDGDARPLAELMSILARAGLAEAAIMVRPVAVLSDGERARLKLAIAMDLLEWTASAAATGSSAPSDGPAGSASALLIADEFTSAVDRATARSIARLVASWIRRSPHCLVAATAHDDILEALRPDILVHAQLAGRTEILAAPRPPTRSAAHRRLVP